ncbi:Filamentous haemagglutinin family outer membrane protein [Bordetella ansorpii]|uniref:Filamentous haemagglutinin family outer membrane protein n=1 Tax=Bordetella ansorpii TaxID=288768 RepID=A0A157PBI1_9BORD|nr:Filamentous haemagglutinin family outer membrane protein [Bordetella ansorpii]
MGRDAGTLVVSTASAVLEGRLVGETFQGTRQTEAPLPEAEGYGQSHRAQSRRGQLIVGDWRYMYDTRSRLMLPVLSATSQNIGTVVVDRDVAALAQSLDLQAALPDDRKGVLHLDTALLDDAQLGSIRIAASKSIAIDATLSTAHGGGITLYAPQIDIRADVVSRGGSIQAGNVLNQFNDGRMQDVALVPAPREMAHVNVAEGVRLDASGLWSNGMDAARAQAAGVYRNGGSVSLRGTGNVNVAEGSVIDVSSGAVLSPEGKLQGGRGGSVTLAADVLSYLTPASSGGQLVFEGQVQGFGVTGGGTLSVENGGRIVLGGAHEAAGENALWLDATLFQQGFANYAINGHGGVTVAEGAEIAPAMPVYRLTAGSMAGLPSDGHAADALSLWLPPLHDEDPKRGVLTQRQGASLALRSARSTVGGAIEIGRGARVAVDPGQSISVVGGGQITVEGRLEAPGGSLYINDIHPEGAAFDPIANARSVWIGEQAVLDVAGRAYVAVDIQGRRYGQVLDGGKIDIGGTLSWETGDYLTDRPMDLHLIIRPGALLDASGAQAVLDLPGRGETAVASNGGSIVLSSANSLYLDGALRAAAGGAGAAGGTLGLSMGDSYYVRNVNPDAGVLQARLLRLAQQQGDSVLRADLRAGEQDDTLVYGFGRIGVDRIEAGGFGNLAVRNHMIAEGDVVLQVSESLRLTGISPLTGADVARSVTLRAPYIRLDRPEAEAQNGDFYVTPSMGGEPGSNEVWKLGHRFEAQADLIDVRGIHAFMPYHDISIYSRGDVRLLPTEISTGAGGSALMGPQNLTVTAAQIYPAIGAVNAGLQAGYYGGALGVSLNNPDAVLALRSPDGAVPDMPFSVFASMRLVAPRIEQGTVVRAPLGAISIGSGQFDASSVTFLPGSVTSVSGAGLVMPYGGTVDGINYLYNGAKIQPVPAGGAGASDLESRALQIQADDITVAAGAILDLSGGGDIRGAGFVNGRGGSVDVLRHAMADSNPATGFKASGNGVYAIVPSFGGSYAPLLADAGAGLPTLGRQVTIERGLPGLPAGTYTLLPSTYALLPGAFRVEIGADAAPTSSAVRTRSGSWATQGQLGTANTGQRNALSNALLVTPADVVRRHSQYNETSYADYLVADAARRGIPRAMLPIDASLLELRLLKGAGMGGKLALDMQGEARFAPAAGSDGFGGTLVVNPVNLGLEILAPGQAPVLGAQAVSVFADALNALKPSRLVLGGSMRNYDGSAAQLVAGGSANLVVRSGAILSAPELILSGTAHGRIVVEPGATLTTLGQGPVRMDTRSGYYLRSDGVGTLVVSNGNVNIVPPTYENATRIDLGACWTADCAGVARIVSEGTIAAATNGVLAIGEAAEYGTRNLLMSVASINLGSAQSLAAAQAAGHLPPGMALSQDLLNSLLRGNTALGAPALESLILSAGDAVNVFGSVTLDTRGTGGASSLQRLVLGAPAIYGYGAAADVATIAANEFVWAGSLAADRASLAPGYGTPAAPGGAVLDRLGDGTLNIAADVIRFDAAPYSTATSLAPAQRLVLGFSALNLNADRMVTGNKTGKLEFYHRPDRYEAGTGWTYQGGDLTVRTPMLTGEAGSVLTLHAGGTLQARGTGAAHEARDALGATVNLAGQRILLDTAVVLPSGRLALEAEGDITLADGAQIDLAGREIALYDARRYSWGGDLVMKSEAGNIAQAAGSRVDLSARYNRAGTLQATALGESAGRVDLAGGIVGTASGVYNAGGTYVPYETAEVALRAQTLADFSGLNARLNEGGVFGARRFQIKQGDLTVGDEVRARHVEIVVDGGSLTVNGRIDASGAQVGSIRLAAQGDLRVNGLLDTHGQYLRRDSYGKIIDAPNRAIIELTSRQGTLVLGQGASFDLRAGTEVPQYHDGQARGTLDLNVRRTGGDDARGALAGSGDGADGVALDVAGTPVILGAKAVSVNAFRRYTDAPLAAQPDVTGKTPQLISQDYFGDETRGIHKENLDFMAAAGANTALGATLARLGAQLRPGVEIASATADGDLTVVGDLDLSNYRYGPQADPTRRGYGTPGVLVLRAGGNLNIYGSINDGFGLAPESPDDKGWQLVEGRYSSTSGQTPFGQELVIPIDGVQLETGTIFPAGSTLNYDVKVQAATLPAGTELPTTMTLNGNLSLPAGLVLTGDVITADGTLYAAGSVLKDTLNLTADARLGAGFRLRSQAAFKAFTWPKGAKLAANLVLAERLTLARGARIPSNTTVELVGDAPVSLRPAGPDGRQGRNWALAPMLGEGATSWSMMLVAGADLGSADMRARNVLGEGDIVLADAHFGQIAFGQRTIELVGGGPMAVTEAGALGIFGDAALAGMTQEEIDTWLQENWGASWKDFFGDATLASMCDWGPSYCVATPSPPKVTEAGAVGIFGDAALAGMTQTEIDTWLQANWGASWKDFFGDATLSSMCDWDPGYCLVEGGTEQETYTHSYASRLPLFSVLRTGTGDLSLLAGRDVGMVSAYGVYTAGAVTSLGAADARFNLPRGQKDGNGVLGMVQRDGRYDAAMAAYQAWYPDHGGNLTIAAGRDVYGDNWGSRANAASLAESQPYFSQEASAQVGNWLWRQGNQGSSGIEDIAASWWINFGAYANTRPYEGGLSKVTTDGGGTRMYGFTGFGTLGGGNLDISAGRHAGVVDARGDSLASRSATSPRSQGLVAAVGSTGRVLDGELVLTGGGDLNVRVGGALNPNARATQQSDGSGSPTSNHYDLGGALDDLDLNGVLTNLRGTLAVSAGNIGAISLKYGDGGGVRATDPFAVGGGLSFGGPRLILGDATAWLDTRGDLVLGAAGDAGRVRQPNTSPYRLVGQADPVIGGGEGWFSLWTPSTSVNLFSAGGNLTPMTANNAFRTSDVNEESAPGSQVYYVYPSQLRAVAAGGDIMLASLNVANYDSLMLAPAPSGTQFQTADRPTDSFEAQAGRLDMLATGSILAGPGAHRMSLSGADAALPSPWRPAFSAPGETQTSRPLGNLSPEGVGAAAYGKPLFVFGPNSPQETSLYADDAMPARFYAVEGDVVGLTTGNVLSVKGSLYYGQPRALDSWYEAALPLDVRAGRDILDLHAVMLHNNSTDVSRVQAGRDVVYADLTVAGPGTLLLQAARQVRQDDVASVRSRGPLIRGDARPGASIAVLAGVGAAGPDYAGFLSRYLDAANAMATGPGNGLDTQPDRVVQTYGGELTLADWLRTEYGYNGTEEDAPAELARRQALRDADTSGPRRDLAQDYREESQLYLVNWLRSAHGYQGDEDGARAALDALAPLQREVYARQLYFAELREGGREYNDETGPRLGSYLRGRRAISAFFPQADAQGQALAYNGDFTMYGGAGLHTDFGGAIQVMTPGGRQVIGLEGVAPPSTAGIVTQGRGDIQMYAQSSILLGQSRIMTTFGGHVLAWSAEGDINAGRGAKTTVVYTPPKRVYDAVGNVALSPTVPSTGAGIATLNPISEIPPGDVDLIAPLGTIDAGEAGIRVSGNINIAALHVVNAANIQVQGESKGIPVVAAVNVGALSNASAAATSAATSAQDAVARSRAAAQKALPSIISVQVLGFGNEPVPKPVPSGNERVSYDSSSTVRVLAVGQPSDAAKGQLTARERANLMP